jgi:hypothetical protein
MPSGTTIRDSWTTAGTLIYSWRGFNVIIDQICNGVKPTSFETAHFYERTNCDWPFGHPDTNAVGYVGYDSTMTVPCYVVYNTLQ